MSILAQATSAMSLWQMYFIVCPLVFLAGFIDSVAGGGGLISTPAFILTGLPMHNVLGTNKLMSTFGTTVAASRYIKSGKVHYKTAIVSAIFSFVGSAMGSQLALMVDSAALKKAFVFLLPFIAIFVLFNKNVKEGTQKLFGTKMYVACGFIGVVIGIYDGIIGPGTGTFLIFGYTSIIGFDYVLSSGNAKIINLASNVAAVISYLLAGKVIWALALPAAAFNMAGCYLGSGYAIKHGAGVIKKMLLVVLVGIFIKLLMDVF
ncbi:MAG: TSUP family transporter [Oscillospiraceae bacterium]